jgi:Tol biopolymer transport system component
MVRYDARAMDEMPVPPPEILEALDRVLGSAAFQGAGRSSRMLRFVVEETLAGRADRLKDYTLGAEVLERGEQFDPRLDPIARVEASRLRARLERYYATDGAADPLVISLPKGGYVPAFAVRPPAATSTAARPPERRVAWPAIAVLLLGAALTWVAVRTSARPSAPPEMRPELTTPPTTDPVSLAMSPDGRVVAFVATGAQHAQLWLRPLASPTDMHALAGTDYASLPFWSPDSRSIGFFADGKIKRIDLASGVVQTIAAAVVPAGASWNRDGVIVYAVVPDGPLFRTTIAGAAPAAATTLTRGQTGHRAPWFLPDGRHFLFYAMGSADVRGIYIGDLDSSVVTRLTDADSPAVFAPPSHVLYVDHGVLFARRINLSTRTLVGDAVPMAEGVTSEPSAGIAALSASAAGPIIYRSGSSGGKRQFVWFDRHGVVLQRLGVPESAGPGYPSLSPDGRHAVVQRTVDGNTDIWTLDLDRNTSMRFTTEPEPDIGALWSPRDDRIVYSSLQAGRFQLFEKPIAGADRTLLLSTPAHKQVTDWSHDGRFLLFRTVAVTPVPDMDIWALPLDTRQPFPVVRTRFEERDGQFSPDGRWVAYQSDESGRDEIYVQPFPGPGTRTRISPGGGVQARWRVDGRQLFYLTLEGELVAVPIALDAGSTTPRIGDVERLFRAPVGSPLGVSLHKYVVSRDGQRFLLDTVVEEPASPIAMVLNWSPPER